MSRRAGAGNNASANPNVDTDLDNMLMTAVLSLFAIIVFAIASRHLAWLSRYIYAPFLTPIYMAGEEFNTLGSAAVILVYTLLAVGAWVVLRFVMRKKGTWSLMMLISAIVWASILVVEIVIGHTHSLITAPMKSFCNPENSGLFAIFSCQNTVADIGTLGTLGIIASSIFPNLVVAIPSMTFIALGFGKLSKHPKTVAKQRFNIDSFIRDQIDVYPHLKLYNIINPNEIDGKSGQLRLMDNSRRLCYEHDLIKGFTMRPTSSSDSYGKKFNKPINLDSKESLPSVDIDDLVPMLDQDKFEALMLNQLGKVYSGVGGMDAAQIIILAITLPRACSIDENMSREEAEAVNKKHYERMDYVWDWVARDIQTVHEVDIGLNAFDKLEEYTEVVAEWLEHEVSQRLLKEHYYTNTFIYRVASEAKRVGVCQPSGFRWLKLYDRKMWALVQNIDRPSVFAENVAVVSHYLMERKTGVGINQPMLQAAYNGVVDNIQKYKFPREKVQAWELFKRTGDKSQMIKLNMIGKDDDDE